MAAMFYVSGLLLCYSWVSVNSLSIDSKVEAQPEDGTVTLHMVKSAYEVNFEGLKKPVKVDCNQEGIICKFPVDEKSRGSGKIRREDEETEKVPIFSGVSVQDEKKDDEKKIRLITPQKDNTEGNKKIPVFKGTVDVESIVSDGKSLDSIADNYIPDKAPVNVYLSRYPNNHVPSVYFMYHSPYDIIDHIGSGPYQYPPVQPTYRWTPFLRPTTMRHPHVVTNAPCDPPIYTYQPPPCNHVRPTQKPVINIDDKIDN